MERGTETTLDPKSKCAFAGAAQKQQRARIYTQWLLTDDAPSGLRVAIPDPDRGGSQHLLAAPGRLRAARPRRCGRGGAAEAEEAEEGPTRRRGMRRRRGTRRSRRMRQRRRRRRPRNGRGARRGPVNSNSQLEARTASPAQAGWPSGARAGARCARDGHKKASSSARSSAMSGRLLGCGARH